MNDFKEYWEIINQAPDAPQYLRAAHWRGFHHAIQTGLTKYQGKSLITKSMHKDGRSIYLTLTFSIIKNSKGETTGALAFIRDHTEQYLKENRKNQEGSDIF